MPAETLKKRLRNHRSLCKLQTLETPIEIMSHARQHGGLIVYYVGDAGDSAESIPFLNSLQTQLSDGRVATVLIVRSITAKFRADLSRFQNISIVSTTTLLGDLELMVLNLLRTVNDEGLFRTGPRITAAKTTSADQGTFLFKGGKRIPGKSIPSSQPNEPPRTASPTPVIEARKEPAPAIPIAKPPEVERKPKVAKSADEFAKKIFAGNEGLRRLFQLVTSAEDRRRLMKDCLDSRANTVMTQPNLEARIDGQFYNYDEEKGTVRFQLKGSAPSIRAFRENLNADTPIIFNASLRQSRLFMAAGSVEWLPDAASLLEMEIPESIYTVQRRKNFRLTFFPDVSNLANASFTQDDKDAFSMPVFDVSQGGLALLATSDEAAKFKSLPLLHNLSLQLEDILIRCPKAHCRHITQLKLMQAITLFRIGFEFEGLSETTRLSLGELIDRHCLSYFSEYLTNKPVG